MFVKPPKELEDCFGFVYDHETYYLTEADNKWEEWHGSSSSLRYNGAIVVSKKIKLKVEQVIGQILNLKKVELPLDKKFSQVIEAVVSGIHHGHVKLKTSVSHEDLRQIPIDLDYLDKQDSCPEFCRCKFGRKDRIWAHKLYHLLLKCCAKEIGISYNNLVSDYDRYKDITIKKVSEYLSVNDWDTKKGIAEEEGAVGFILVSYLKNYREFFRLANIQYLGEELLIDKNPFDDCMKGKCKYDEQYIIWESKSTIQTTNKLPIEKGVQIPAAWMPDIIEKRVIERMQGKPLATVRQDGCICSTEKYYFGLYINEVVDGKVKEKCIKDFRDETKLSENDQIDILIAEFYSHFLPKKQAKLASKIIKRQYYQYKDNENKDNENITKELDNKNNPETLEDKERHSKFLLRKTLENVVSHWPDIKHLSEQISKPKGSKRKGGDNDE